MNQAGTQEGAPWELDWQRHAEFLRRVARGLLVSEHDADDLVQDTLFTTLRSPPRTLGNFRGWLSRVLSNSLRQEHRRAARIRWRESESAQPEELPSAAEIAQRAELTRRIAELVSQLPEPYRTTLHLRFWEGLSASEIARRTGAPVETVRTRDKRARLTIEKQLDESYGQREVWAGLLLAVRPRSGVLVATTAGVIAMKSSLKVLLASVVVLLLGGGVWWLSADSSDPASLDLVASREHVFVGPVQPEPDPGGAAIEAERVAEDEASQDGAQGPVTVRGTLVVVDREGNRHTQCDGSLTIEVWSTRNSRRYDQRSESVPVSNGKWTTVAIPEQQFHVRDIEVDGQLVMTVSPNGSIPPDGEVLVEARLCYGTTLHVVDAGTGEELDEVEIAGRVDWVPPDGDFHPGEHHHLETVVERATSPIHLSARRGRYFYWARAPGYGWGKFDVDHTRDFERTVELREGTDLEVLLDGSDTPADTWIRLRSPGQSRANHVVQVHANPRGPTLVEELPAGEYTTYVELGRWDSITELAVAGVTLEVGATASVTLSPDTSMLADVVPLRGEIVVAESYGDETFGLAFDQESASGALKQELVQLSWHECVPVPGDRGRYSWDAGEVAPGIYGVTVSPLNYRFRIDVGETGVTDVVLKLPEAADVHLSFVEEGTDQALCPLAVYFYGELPEGIRSSWSSSAVLHAGTETWRFRTAAGAVKVSVGDEDLARLDTTLTLKPGLNQFRIPLKRATGFKLMLVTEGKPLRTGWEYWCGVPFERKGSEPDDVQGSFPWGGKGWTSSDRYVLYSDLHPGLYVVNLPAPPGFRAPEPIEIEVTEGVVKEVVVALEAGDS